MLFKNVSFSAGDVSVGCAFCVRSGQGYLLPIFCCNTPNHMGACGLCVMRFGLFPMFRFVK